MGIPGKAPSLFRSATKSAPGPTGSAGSGRREEAPDHDDQHEQQRHQQQPEAEHLEQADAALLPCPGGRRCRGRDGMKAHGVLLVPSLTYLLAGIHALPSGFAGWRPAGAQTSLVWRKYSQAKAAPTSAPPTASSTTCCRVAIVDQTIRAQCSALSRGRIFGAPSCTSTRLSQNAANTADATCSEGKALPDASRPLMTANSG